MEAVSEEESKDKYLPPDPAEYSDHHYSTNAPHPDLVRACEDDDVEQVRQAVNSGTATEPVIRPDLMEEVPESYFQNVLPSKRIPMTIMVSQKYPQPPPPPNKSFAMHSSGEIARYHTFEAAGRR